jgi:putative ABC transport system permease protein
MPSIARKNLFEDIPRLLVAQAGILFAVTLVTVQTGVLKGFTDSASLLVDRSNADLWVTSKDLVHLELTLPLNFEQLGRVQRLKGVARAEPLVFGKVLWRAPNDRIESVIALGFEPNGQLFQPWNIIQGDRQQVKQPYGAVTDITNLKKLGLKGVGDRGSVGSIPVRVVAVGEGMQSIVFSSFLFMSVASANSLISAGRESRLTCNVLPDGGLDCINRVSPRPEQERQPAPPRPPNGSDPVNYILVRVQPGTSIPDLKRRITAVVPGSRVFTRAELARLSQTYWRDRTGVGSILILGAIVGTIVGIATVGQILYASASERIREFATLKAMGASSNVLRGIIVEQSLWMALLGYLPGMGLCLGLARFATTLGIVITITPASAALTFAITVAMCVSSALFAIQKVNRIDPAVVFKA